MRILMVVASLHGSTWDLGEEIAAELRSGGHQVRLSSPQDAPTGPDALAEVDAVVLGSAVYLMQWMAPIRTWITENLDRLQRLPHAAFSVGLTGAAPMVPRELSPVSTVLLRGRLDVDALGGLPAPGGAASGDFTDPDAARAWAREAVQALGA